MSQSLKELKELTRKLPKLSNLYIGTTKTFIVDKGKCTCYMVLNIGSIAIMRCDLEANTVFPTHRHDTREIIICYSGQFIATGYHNNDIILNPTEYIVSEVGDWHGARTDVDTSVIAITIPSDEGYLRD
jgi:quercetin dioxygenase-like cupin family protein